ncbi:hypothetical protein ZWY2020_054946 [Hordeum vulgare]|nr:hypothetical protein ZWY2020_054946 [Hordeum vulgare]
MSIFLVAAMVACLVSHGAGTSMASAAWDDQDFFRNYAAIPIFGTGYYDSASNNHSVDQGTLRFYDIVADWSEQEPTSVASQCQKCELNGQRCAFSSQRNETFCSSQPHKGSRVKVISVLLQSTLYFYSKNKEENTLFILVLSMKSLLVTLALNSYFTPLQSLK